VVAVVLVDEVVVGLVELVEVEGVLLDELEDDELLEDEVVGVDTVVELCWRQSLAASCAIVAAPWVRFSRSVGLTVIGSVATSALSAALALTAAPQSPACTAELISLPWPLSAIDWSPESRPAPPPQAATHETAKPSPPARMARGA
jgi:hypothetical protein